MTRKTTKRCDSFCKLYIKNLNRKFLQRAEPYIPTKRENEKNYQDCRRIHCNESCNNVLIYGSPEEKKAFQKEIKHGFHKNYTRKQVTHLKKKGALSGCTSFDMMLV